MKTRINGKELVNVDSPDHRLRIPLRKRPTLNPQIPYGYSSPRTVGDILAFSREYEYPEVVAKPQVRFESPPAMDYRA
jgi:hypothetical protein